MKPFFNMYLVVTLQIIGIVSGQGQDVCYSIGECLQSPYIDVISTATPKECSAHCDSFNDDEDTCLHFTHFASTGDCYAFKTCTVFSSATCNDCVSGPRQCQATNLCGLPGQCELGDPLGVATGIASEESCLSQCKDTSGPDTTCNWYTYFSNSQECYLWKTCPEISSELCSDCTYGEQLCPVINPAGNYIMVLGGEDDPFETSDNAFIIRLETEDRPDDDCYSNINVRFKFGNDIVYGIQEHIMVLNGNGDPVVCGGLIGRGELEPQYPMGRNCFVPIIVNDGYDFVMRNTTYDMLQERIGAFALLLDDGRYWIIGGSENSAETEIFSDNTFSPGPTLPENLDRACAANIGGGKVIVSGGVSLVNDANLNSVYQYDFGTNAWTQLPSMAEARHGHSCGTRVTTGVLEFHAIGGVGSETTGEVFDVANGVWSSGIPYRNELRYGSSLPYQGSFLVVGGRNTEGDAFYGDIRLLTREDKWEQRGFWSPGLEQTAAVFITEDKVSKYGCPELL